MIGESPLQETKKGNRNCLSSLFAQVKCLDYLTVPADILVLQVIEQTPSLSDQLYQRPLSAEILFVTLQMFSEVGNPVGEKCNLTLSITRVHF